MTPVAPIVPLPESRWPSRDRQLWAAALTAGDVLDAPGRAARWRPPTRHKVAGSYGRWLTFLATSGHLDEDGPPHQRVTSETLGRYVAALHGQVAPTTLWSYVADLALWLRACCPEQDHGLLQRTVARLRLAAVPVRDIESRVRSSRVLFGRALDWLDGVDERPAPFWHSRPVAFRDGLMLALVAARPLRLRSLASLETGTSLVRSGSGYRLVLDRSAMKSGRHYEAPLPDALTAAMDRYLAEHRPALLQSGDSRALWISKEGRPLGVNGLARRFKKATPRILGEELNAHSFRHSAATSIAIDDGDAVHIIQPLLGHATLAVAERYYNKARAIEAADRYHSGLRDLRRRLRRDQPVRERP